MTRAKDISKILTDADISGTLDVTGETTLATHLNMGDGDIIKLGASADLTIQHDGSDSKITDSGTGNLVLDSDGTEVRIMNGSEFMGRFQNNDAVKLFFDNSKKFETTSSGVTVTGGVTTTTASSIEGGVVFNESSADVDFRVESNSNANAFFLEASTGRIGMGTSAMGDYHANRDDLVIATSGSTGITIVAGGSGHQSAIAFADGTGDSEEDAGLLMYNHNGNKMSFHVSDAEVFAADSNGLLINTSTTNPGQNNTTTGASIVAGRFMFNNSGTDNIMGRADNGGLLSIRRGGTEVGLISVSASSTSYATSSDYRLKENIDYTWDATSRLKQLKPARFNFISDADTIVDGFIAHEVSSIVPEAITGEKDAMTEEVLYVDGDEIPDGKKIGDVKEASEINPQSIDQAKLVPLLVKTIQELEARITALESA